MTKEILDGNKAIAKLCGVSVYPEKDSKEEKKWKGERCDYTLHSLQYHESWDWLIPAHNKSRKLFFALDKDIQREFIQSNNLIVERNGFVNFFSTFENQYTISSCWIKMVDFAKWYNSLPK